MSCGGWTAHRPEAGPAELTGDGDPVDGLRALCAVAWSGPRLIREQAESALHVLKRAF